MQGWLAGFSVGAAWMAAGWTWWSARSIARDRKALERTDRHISEQVQKLTRGDFHA